MCAKGRSGNRRQPEEKVALMRGLTAKWSFVFLALAPLLLSACKREVAVPMLAAPAARAFAMPTDAGDANRRIAFTHNFAVELPSDAVQATQQKNLADCLAAGCSVLSTRLDRLSDAAVHASISVRIAPDRYRAFADSVTAPPARLISHAETADDEAIPLLDIQKRLDSQVALRDRLAQMLKQAGTNVTDLVAVEKQLADVQGTIESETAQRDYLNTITGTVKVDVTYNGLIQQAGPFDVSPIRSALDGFAHTVIGSVGEMIDWIAYALPWLPLAALAGCAVRWVLRRRFP
jgi:hypothetical protein